MDHPLRTTLLKRLKNIEGHVRGIAGMVEKDAYCIDLVNQVLAVQRALEKLNQLVLHRHLQTCVSSAMRSQNPGDRERVIAEIMDVFKARSVR